MTSDAAKRLFAQWMDERVRGLNRDATVAIAGLGERVLPNGSRLPALETEYKRARHVLARRLRSAAALFDAPLTDDEWAGR
jgi:hypothetical protein